MQMININMVSLLENLMVAAREQDSSTYKNMNVVFSLPKFSHVNLEWIHVRRKNRAVI